MTAGQESGEAMARIGKWWRVMNRVMEDIDRMNLGLIAAGCAFFGMVSIFPAIAAIIAIFGLLADPVVVIDQLELMRDLMPEAAYTLIADQAEALIEARSDTLGWASGISLMIALWSTRAGVDAIMRGLNEIHGRPKRAGFKRMLVALMLTISLVGVAIVALLAVVVTPIVLAFLPLGPYQVAIAELLRWSVALGVLIVGLGILYRFGPNARGARPGWFTPGAGIAVAGWLIASVLFSVYLSNFANYNRFYGSIGAVVALLMWFYITAFLVLMGAVLNLRLSRRAARRSEERARLAG